MTRGPHLFAESPSLLLSLLLVGADLPLELSLQRLQRHLQPQPGVLGLRQLLLQLLRLDTQAGGLRFQRPPRPLQLVDLRPEQRR